MTTSTADTTVRARTHAHTQAYMHAQLFLLPIPAHLLGPGGASQFQCQLCFVFAKHKGRKPEFFLILLHSIMKNILWRKKNLFCRTKPGWKQDVQTEGFVFVRFIASVLTALHPGVNFLSLQM